MLREVGVGHVAIARVIDYIFALVTTSKLSKMTPVALKVMSTVNAPYGAVLSAAQLADMIVDIKSADNLNSAVFAFLSDVSPKLQMEFIDQMGVSRTAVAKVASKFSRLAGYKLALSD